MTGNSLIGPRTLVLVLCLLFFSAGSAQNLLPNPDFESYSSCPSGPAQLTRGVPWFIPSGHTGSPDYIHVCATSGLVDVPNNAFGSQTPNSGNGYIGMALFYQSYSNFREYAQVQLLSPLTAGTTYRISMYVSLADNSTHTTDALEFYFSSAPVSWGGGGWPPMTTYTPQARLAPGTYLNNKTAWTQVSAVFTATGGEQYMTMGNFKTDANTAQIFVGSGSVSTGYIYIDDAVLEPDAILAAELKDLTAKADQDHIRVRWSTLGEMSTDHFEIERSEGDHLSWEKIAELGGAGYSEETNQYSFADRTALPETEYWYRVRVIDQNGESSYSHAVSAKISESGADLLSIFPNPLSSEQSLNCKLELERHTRFSVSVLDLQGKTVHFATYEGKEGVNEFTLERGALRPGTFLMKVTTPQQTLSRTFTVW